MYKVILIDDEPWLLKDMELLIDWERFGFEVTAKISDSEQAIYMIKKHRPDLIICDIKMPGLNGIELMKMVKQRFNDIFVVFVSAYSEFSYAKQAIEMGAYNYILKPTEEEELSNTLKKIATLLDKEKEDIYYNTGESHDIVGDIIEEIQLNFNEDLKLQDLADKYHVNYNYLSQLFKKETGKTFTNYLVEFRIERAIRLFSEDLLFYEIAKKVGYNDYYHFCKIFKKHKGISPREFKNMHIR